MLILQKNTGLARLPNRLVERIWYHSLFLCAAAGQLGLVSAVKNMKTAGKLTTITKTSKSH